jgi:hypothetical protein
VFWELYRGTEPPEILEESNFWKLHTCVLSDE